MKTAFKHQRFFKTIYPDNWLLPQFSYLRKNHDICDLGVQTSPVDSGVLAMSQLIVGTIYDDIASVLDNYSKPDLNW